MHEMCGSYPVLFEMLYKFQIKPSDFLLSNGYNHQSDVVVIWHTYQRISADIKVTAKVLYLHKNLYQCRICFLSHQLATKIGHLSAYLSGTELVSVFLWNSLGAAELILSLFHNLYLSIQRIGQLLFSLLEWHILARILLSVVVRGGNR